MQNLRLYEFSWSDNVSAGTICVVHDVLCAAKEIAEQRIHRKVTFQSESKVVLGLVVIVTTEQGPL